MSAIPHIPVLRLGESYTSLDVADLIPNNRTEPVARISQANAGLIRRDLTRRIDAAAESLRRFTVAQLLEMAAHAGDLYVNATLPLGVDGETQSPDDYIRQLSSTSGMPHTLVRRNMGKVHQVFTEMPEILNGLTRGLDLSFLDTGYGEIAGSPVAYYPVARSMGVVLPSNSPGVNSIWMPAPVLKVPVVLKPGREEPWTPMRIIQAFIAAGFPREAFGFYPTSHDGANVILEYCDRAQLFGDKSTTDPHRNNPAIELHGPGWSKVLIGEDMIDRWPEFLDVLVDSVAANGGRSCINASAVIVPRHGREIAEAIAQRLVEMKPRPADAPDACLSAFANPAMAQWIDSTITEGLAEPGAEDVTARLRGTDRALQLDGLNYLYPTLVRCDSFEHPLANTEFLFPYAAVSEMPQSEMVAKIGPSLVVTAITEDPAFRMQLMHAPHIDRLNLGALPTSVVQWNQPHEGNLFEFLYRRRAIQGAQPLATA